MRKTFFLPILCLTMAAGCSTATTQPTPAANTPAANVPAANQPQAQVPAQAAQTYTLADVAKHATASDCWQAYQGKVYDMTAYIPNHPAGDKILAGCGKDITAMYEGIKDGKGHSDYATSLFDEYYKGNLK
jgi:cytochrome b involved in lipid metabolism